MMSKKMTGRKERGRRDEKEGSGPERGGTGGGGEGGGRKMLTGRNTVQYLLDLSSLEYRKGLTLLECGRRAAGVRMRWEGA